VGGGQVGGGGDLLLFDAKRGAFGVEHGEEVDGAGLVFLPGEGGGVAGGGGGGGERGESLRLAADGREGVLDLGERGEHRRLVGDEHLFLGGGAECNRVVDAAAGEDRRGQAADKVGHGGLGREELAGIEGVDAQRAGQLESGETVALCRGGAGGGGFDGPAGGADIGALAQGLGRDADGDRRRGGGDGACGGQQGVERAGRLPAENGEAVARFQDRLLQGGHRGAGLLDGGDGLLCIQR